MLLNKSYVNQLQIQNSPKSKLTKAVLPLRVIHLQLEPPDNESEEKSDIHEVHK